MFSLELSILTISLMAAALLLGLFAILLIIPQLRRVSRATVMDDDERQQVAMMTGFPPCSIIVHARSDGKGLQRLIPQLMGQDYPSPYEVIVVNDGGDEAVTDAVGYLQTIYSGLYMTFAPARSRNLSRKKLSITLGLKAARYDSCVILAGNCRLTSPLWLRMMMRHMAMGKEIVVGYGYMVPTDDEYQERHRLMSFDIVRTAVQYLGSALTGRLYRSFPTNVAYSRELFFDNKGFSGALNLRYGDDDIFISRIAGKRNFAVELSEESLVQVAEENPEAAHRVNKVRHIFTGRSVYAGERIKWGLSSLMWWAWTLLSVLAIIVGLPSLVPLIGVTVASLMVCLPLMFVWRRTSVCLHGRKLLFTVPLFMWIYPFYSLYYMLLERRHRRDNYTWSTVHS